MACFEFATGNFLLSDTEKMKADLSSDDFQSPTGGEILGLD